MKSIFVLETLAVWLRLGGRYSEFPLRGHPSHYSFADAMPNSVQTKIISNIIPITQVDRILLTKEFFSIK